PDFEYNMVDECISIGSKKEGESHIYLDRPNVKPEHVKIYYKNKTFTLEHKIRKNTHIKRNNELCKKVENIYDFDIISISNVSFRIEFNKKYYYKHNTLCYPRRRINEIQKNLLSMNPLSKKLYPFPLLNNPIFTFVDKKSSTPNKLSSPSLSQASTSVNKPPSPSPNIPSSMLVDSSDKTIGVKSSNLANEYPTSSLNKLPLSTPEKPSQLVEKSSVDQPLSQLEKGSLTSENKLPSINKLKPSYIVSRFSYLNEKNRPKKENYESIKLNKDFLPKKRSYGKTKKEVIKENKKQRLDFNISPLVNLPKKVKSETKEVKVFSAFKYFYNFINDFFKDEKMIDLFNFKMKFKNIKLSLSDIVNYDSLQDYDIKFILNTLIFYSKQSYFPYPEDLKKFLEELNRNKKRIYDSGDLELDDGEYKHKSCSEDEESN
ncbi:hypothetical protein ACTFIU_008496, partial [Dictyostelium citrinum]